MTLSEAIDNGLELVVDHPIGGLRFIAELFITEHGIAFADIGWNTDNSHGVHILEGELTGAGPWKIGKAVIRELERSDSVTTDRDKWERYRNSAEGRNATRENCFEYMAGSFGWNE